MIGRVALALVALALPVACTTAHDDRVDQEIALRDEYSKRVLVENDAGRLLGVASKSDVLFEEGFAPISFLPPDSFRNHASRWIGQNAHVRLKAHPGHTMRLHVQGWTSEGMLRTKPQISLFLDGVLLATHGPIEGGQYWIDVDVPPERVGREWVDLNIRLNTVAFHWTDPPILMVADVYNLSWTELR